MVSGRRKDFHAKLLCGAHRSLFERQTLNYLFTKLSGGAYRIISFRDNHRNPNIHTALAGRAKITSLVERSVLEPRIIPRPPNEQSCTTETALFSHILLVVTGTWHSPYESPARIGLQAKPGLVEKHHTKILCCGVHNACILSTPGFSQATVSCSVTYPPSKGHEKETLQEAPKYFQTFSQPDFQISWGLSLRVSASPAHLMGCWGISLGLFGDQDLVCDILMRCQVIYSQFGLAIHQNDHQARRRFVEWAQNEIAVVPDFHKRILFSKEAHFWLNGYVNKQNCRIWSEANPQVYVETPLHPEKLIVWCALCAGGILLQKR
ncbi:uncharacterized protein TNCV_1221081 [Trichonephila clavipes]|nr:uncharacterized protein TNCV_1221081 [Trichonephila clavipes]